MTHKISLFALAMLLACACAYAYATVDVVTRLPTAEVCDEDGRRCQGGTNGEWTAVYTQSEVDLKFSSIAQQIASLQSENKTLKSVVDQREADLKALTIKADLADKRIAKLEKDLRDLAARIPVQAQKGASSLLKPSKNR